MPAEVHFAKFFAAFLATLKYGMEGTQAACKNGVRTLQEELEQLRRTVEVYLQRHYKARLEHKDKVRDVLLTAMNGGGDDLPREAGGLPTPEAPIRGSPFQHRHPHGHAGFHAAEGAGGERHGIQPAGAADVPKAGASKNQPQRGRELPAREGRGPSTRKAGQASEQEAGPRLRLPCSSGVLRRACAI